MPKQYCSRLFQLLKWLHKASKLEIAGYILFLFIFFLLISQQDKFHLYVPVGTYAEYLEYVTWIVIGSLIYREYKKIDEIEECDYLQSKLKKRPFVRLSIASIAIFFLTYLFFYMIGIYAHKFHSKFEYKTYHVKILDVSKRGRKKCKPRIQTDFLAYISPKNQTLFYKFVKEYSFDKICTKGIEFYEGQRVVLNVKETPFGLYVYDIKSDNY